MFFDLLISADIIGVIFSSPCSYASVRSGLRSAAQHPVIRTPYDLTPSHRIAVRKYAYIMSFSQKCFCNTLIKSHLKLYLFAACPLPSWCIQSLLRIHSEINSIHNYLKLSLRRIKPPITPNGPTGFPSFDKKPGMIV